MSEDENNKDKFWMILTVFLVILGIIYKASYLSNVFLIGLLIIMFLQKDKGYKEKSFIPISIILAIVVGVMLRNILIFVIVIIIGFILECKIYNSSIASALAKSIISWKGVLKDLSVILISILIIVIIVTIKSLILY